MWNRLPLIMLITCLYHAFHVKEILISKFGMTVYANNRHLCGYIFVICNFICFFIRFRVSSLSVKVLIGIFFWSLKFPLTADKRSHVICKWVLFWSLDSLICLSSIVPCVTHSIHICALSRQGKHPENSMVQGLQKPSMMRQSLQ